MKNLLLLIFLTMSTYSLLAQTQYATTKDGRTVILKSNGTWEYAKDNKKLSTLTKKTVAKPATNAPRNNTNTTQQQKKTAPPKRTKKSATKRYITGSRGGCYYINSSGNKTYVDRSFCK